MKRRSLLTAGALGSVSLVLAACSDNAGGTGDDGEFDPGNRATMIVPFSAGGGSDIAGRAIATGLEEVTGTTITVENSCRGPGAVGYTELVNAEGDGTVLLASETALITLPIVQDVDFRYEKLTPIMKAGEDFNIVVVAATPLRVDHRRDRGCQEREAHGCGLRRDRARPHRLEPHRAGAGHLPGAGHLQSSSEVLAALMGGHVQVAASSPGELTGQLESGDIRALCALAPERYEYDLLADVPTGEEEGVNVTFASGAGSSPPAGSMTLRASTRSRRPRSADRRLCRVHRDEHAPAGHLVRRRLHRLPRGVRG